MQKKTRLLISAAGTASAFHLAEMVRTRFDRQFELHLCDINPRHLVASSTFADKFHTVPPAADSGFINSMLDLMVKESIQVYSPLVDAEVYAFPCDEPQLQRLGIAATSPPTATARLMSRKSVLTRHLSELGFPVPRVFSRAEIEPGAPEKKFFIKPESGFGSRGTSVMTSHQIISAGILEDSNVAQEVCQPPEVTVEVFNARGEVRSLCRERLEVKQGVCTKARLWRDEELSALTKRLCRTLSLPVAFCFQVMKNSAHQWVITDLNPRLGAGTSLSSVCGWNLAAAALVVWGGLPENPLDCLDEFKGERFAVRAHRDFRTQ